MTDYVRMGTHNMVLPPEGPKAFPNLLMFVDVDTVALDFKDSVSRGYVSFIQSIYVDNSKNENPLQIETGQVGQRISFPSRSQGYMMLFVTDDAVLTFKTPKADQLIVQVIASNTPVYPAIWKVE